LVQNAQLEDNLNTYAETFENQSLTFRSALEKLKKENDYLFAEAKRLKDENKKLSELNRTMKIDFESTKTSRFFDNNSNLSLQLRKTVSTELHDSRPACKYERQGQCSREKEKLDGVTRLKST
jgi:hypothetical protein